MGLCFSLYLYQRFEEVGTLSNIGFVAQLSLCGRNNCSSVAVQMYPKSSGQVDAMAANEVATHINLQLKQDSPYLCKLLGGFEVKDSDGREQASFCPIASWPKRDHIVPAVPTADQNAYKLKSVSDIWYTNSI